MANNNVVSTKKLLRRNLHFVRQFYPQVERDQLFALRDLTRALHLSVSAKELLLIDGRWYVSHQGLLGIAHRRGCLGICTEIQERLSEPSSSRWVFKSTVRKSVSKSFDGFGDADPSNVSPMLHGAELRMAETRAVNRALRKAYGIGLCSVEEIGPNGKTSFSTETRIAPQSTSGKGFSNPPLVRDRLCQLIRQHHLDPNLVKAYAVDFCGTKTLKEATREQVENFVQQLADWAQKDRSALLCQLNSYLGNSDSSGSDEPSSDSKENAA